MKSNEIPAAQRLLVRMDLDGQTAADLPAKGLFASRISMLVDSLPCSFMPSKIRVHALST